ncbi:unnamed protein product [Ceratitis capitata]|uniref:(Mediterranean fruit fly) hypothetical protein n=1 Tax=Ceratitis capitata TaxID=7213 RepID=A0A811VGM9_CERCA|nr:unnamed protein product [Ceratitis capitata]
MPTKWTFYANLIQLVEPSASHSTIYEHINIEMLRISLRSRLWERSGATIAICALNNYTLSWIFVALSCSRWQVAICKLTFHGAAPAGGDGDGGSLTYVAWLVGEWRFRTKRCI